MGAQLSEVKLAFLWERTPANQKPGTGEPRLCAWRAGTLGSELFCLYSVCCISSPRDEFSVLLSCALGESSVPLEKERVDLICEGHLLPDDSFPDTESSLFFVLFCFY